MRRTLVFFAALLLAVAAFGRAARAAPKVALEGEKAELGASLYPGEWFDVLVEVDPGKDSVLQRGLSVSPKPFPGAQFRPAILPPSQNGLYGKPFTIRLPVRFDGGKQGTVDLMLKGQSVSGGPFRLNAKTDLYFPFPQRTNDVTGTISLEKSPAKQYVENAFVLHLAVKKGFHVYGKAGKDEGYPLSAEMLPNGPVRQWTGGGPANLPGKDVTGTFDLKIPFTPTVSGKIETRVLLFWQACTDKYCDPNEFRYYPVSIEVEKGESAPPPKPHRGSGAAGGGPSISAPPPAPSAPSAGGGDGAAAGGSLWGLLLAAVGAGLLALAMPCTYPMIPITVSFFTHQAEHHGRVTGLALTYGAGIVGIFLVVGTAVGTPIVQFAAAAWVNAIFGILFLVFGLSLVGLFELRLPGWFNDLAAGASRSGGYLGVLAMGATLVITSFTCTAPFVGSLLVYASKGGDVGRVAFAMGIFGLTMAVPFVFLSMSPTALRKLPKSGEWMKTLKVTLGILEIGLVLKFVSNIDLAIGTQYLGRDLFLALWGVSFLIAALYLFGIFDLFRKGVRWHVGRGRALAATLLLGLTVYLGSGLLGNPLAFGNLEAFLPRTEGHGERERYARNFADVVKEDYQKGVQAAKKLGKPIFLHFTGFN